MFLYFVVSSPIHPTFSKHCNWSTPTCPWPDLLLAWQWPFPRVFREMVKEGTKAFRRYFFDLFWWFHLVLLYHIISSISALHFELHLLLTSVRCPPTQVTSAQANTTMVSTRPCGWLNQPSVFDGWMICEGYALLFVIAPGLKWNQCETLAELQCFASWFHGVLWICSSAHWRY